MKIKIKDLEEINYLTLKDIVEEAIQTGMTLILGDDDTTLDYIVSKSKTEEYEEAIENVLNPINLEKFDLNKEIAGKKVNVKELVDAHTNELVEYELIDYSTKPFEVTISKEYAEV